MKTRLLALILLLAPSPASALTGSEVYEWCSVRDDQMHRAFCTIYVRGLMDGLFYGEIAAQMGRHYCPPQDYTIPQGELIIKKYLSDHPELLEMDGGSLAAKALYLAFPCPSAE